MLYGAVDVALPTIRRALGLSLVQLGLLAQILNWVALVVEPPAAALVDLRSRRGLMAAGAAGLGIATLVIGGATGYPLLVAGFALYGVGSGPLVNTADVVVVESFPEAPERAFSRATFFDTIGALLGPALVAVTVAAGLSWRVSLGVLAGGALAYAVALARTPMPPPRGAPGGGRLVVAALVGNARDVLRDGAARRALLVLLCFDVFEAAFVLKYVWLAETVGLGQAWVAAYAAGEQAVSLIALVVLDRWLATREGGRVLRLAAAALVVLPAAWVAAPGVAGRVALGVPLALAQAVVWPLAKSRSLTAVPGLAGAAQAITTMFPILPLAVLEAWFAARTGIGPAMAATAAFGALLMVLTVASTPVVGITFADPGTYGGEQATKE